LELDFVKFFTNNDGVLVRLGKFFVVFTLVTMLGGQWTMLQSIAWVGMIANYSENGTFKEALVKTFDGKHPCCLCKAIAAGKKSEKKNEFTMQMQKLEFPPAKENFVLIAPSQFHLFPLVNSFADSLIQKPPTPPPRGLFV
jgi:hypothetical protein